MRTIRIDTMADTSFLYADDEWKNYVFNREDFDNRFVITGNRSFIPCTDAKWYRKAKKLFKLIDSNYSYDEIEERDFCTAEQWKKAESAHSCANGRDDLLVILNIARILYPEETFEMREIRGSSQGEWQYAVFRETGVENPQKVFDTLEAFYFGNVAEIRSRDEDEMCFDVTYVTLDELWKAEREDRIEQFVRESCGVDPEEPIEIYLSDGEIRRTKWTLLFKKETGRAKPHAGKKNEDSGKYVVVQTVDRKTNLLEKPSGEKIMSFREAVEAMTRSFCTECLCHGRDVAEYVSDRTEDDEAGFAENSTYAYTNFGRNIDWVILKAE